MGRADFYRDASGFRLLEINWGAALGGLDSAVLNEAMVRQPFVGDFVRKHRLGYVDPMAEMVHTLFTECAVPAGSRPVVALTDWPESFRTLEPRLRKNVPTYDRFGIEALPCHVGQLRYERGRVWLGDRAIDVVYRLFLLEDLLAADGPALIEPVLRAAERGEVAIFSPMDADLYGSKGALALLSDEASRPLYPPAMLAVLDRILPWTRMVRPGPVTVSGTRRRPCRPRAAHRRELILKPTLMHGGLGIVAGWLTDAAEWRARLAEAMGGPYVLAAAHPPGRRVLPRRWRGTTLDADLGRLPGRARVRRDVRAGQPGPGRHREHVQRRHRHLLFHRSPGRLAVRPGRLSAGRPAGQRVGRPAPTTKENTARRGGRPPWPMVPTTVRDWAPAALLGTVNRYRTRPCRSARPVQTVPPPAERRSRTGSSAVKPETTRSVLAPGRSRAGLASSRPVVSKATTGRSWATGRRVGNTVPVPTTSEAGTDSNSRPRAPTPSVAVRSERADSPGMDRSSLCGVRCSIGHRVRG